MTIEAWLGICLIFSIFVNFVLVWFSREQSRKVFYTSQNLADLVEIISSYRGHLKSVYEMEAFYGDTTLEFLLQHTRDIVTILENEYGDITYITEPLEVDLEEIKEIEEKQETFKEGQDVLYAGPRRRDS
jgi:hypothetical protein